MKQTITIALLFFMASCYKVPDGSVPTSAPHFVATLDGDLLTDTLLYLKTNNNYSYTDNIIFTATTPGDVAKFPVTCHIHGQPPGVTITPDSFTLKLNSSQKFTVSATTPVAGRYYILVDITSAAYGLQSYPVRLMVYP